MQQFYQNLGQFNMNLDLHYCTSGSQTHLACIEAGLLLDYNLVDMIP